MLGTYALSKGYYDAFFKKASQVRTLMINDFKEAYRRCHVIITPVAPTPAFKIGEKIDDPLTMYLHVPKRYLHLISKSGRHSMHVHPLWD